MQMSKTACRANSLITEMLLTQGELSSTLPCPHSSPPACLQHMCDAVWLRDGRRRDEHHSRHPNPMQVLHNGPQVAFELSQWHMLPRPAGGKR